MAYKKLTIIEKKVYDTPDILLTLFVCLLFFFEKWIYTKYDTKTSTRLHEKGCELCIDDKIVLIQ